MAVFLKYHHVQCNSLLACNAPTDQVTSSAYNNTNNYDVWSQIGCITGTRTPTLQTYERICYRFKDRAFTESNYVQFGICKNQGIRAKRTLNISLSGGCMVVVLGEVNL